jgi:hypothetical protein
MFDNITKTCQKFNTALEHRGNPTDKEKMSLEYLNLDLAKAIIEDLDEHNVKCIAKIILGFVE